jgi:hypothetical protein
MSNEEAANPFVSKDAIFFYTVGTYCVFDTVIPISQTRICYCYIFHVVSINFSVILMAAQFIISKFPAYSGR